MGRPERERRGAPPMGGGRSNSSSNNSKHRRKRQAFGGSSRSSVNEGVEDGLSLKKFLSRGSSGGAYDPRREKRHKFYKQSTRLQKYRKLLKREGYGDEDGQREGEAENDDEVSSRRKGKKGKKGDASFKKRRKTTGFKKQDEYSEEDEQEQESVPLDPRQQKYLAIKAEREARHKSWQKEEEDRKATLQRRKKERKMQSYKLTQRTKKGHPRVHHMLDNMLSKLQKQRKKEQGGK